MQNVGGPSDLFTVWKLPRGIGHTNLGSDSSVNLTPKTCVSFSGLNTLTERQSLISLDVDTAPVLQSQIEALCNFFKS